MLRTLLRRVMPRAQAAPPRLEPTLAPVPAARAGLAAGPANGRQPGSEVTPKPTPTAKPPAAAAPAPLLTVPAREQARALLEWVTAPAPEGVPGETVTPVVLAAMYADMCEDQGWQARPWQTIAREFTRLTTGAKIYRYVQRPDGSRVKHRFYPIPSSMPAASVLPLRRAA